MNTLCKHQRSTTSALGNQRGFNPRGDDSETELRESETKQRESNNNISYTAFTP